MPAARIGGSWSKLDNRQGEPEWSPEGDAVYFTVQERGLVRLYRARLSSRTAGGGDCRAREQSDPGLSGPGGSIAYAFTTPDDLAQLYLVTGNGPAAEADRPQRGSDAGQGHRTDRIFHFHQQRQQVGGGGVSDASAGPDHQLQASTDRRHPRRTSLVNRDRHSISGTRSTRERAGGRSW